MSESIFDIAVWDGTVWVETNEQRAFTSDRYTRSSFWVMSETGQVGTKSSNFYCPNSYFWVFHWFEFRKPFKSGQNRRTFTVPTRTLECFTNLKTKKNLTKWIAIHSKIKINNKFSDFTLKMADSGKSNNFQNFCFSKFFERHPRYGIRRGQLYIGNYRRSDHPLVPPGSKNYWGFWQLGLYYSRCR